MKVYLNGLGMLLYVMVIMVIIFILTGDIGTNFLDYILLIT